MDRYRRLWFVILISCYHSHALNDAHTAVNSSKYRVLIVQPGSGFQRDEELRSVGVGARIGHAEDSRSRVLQVASYFVFKFAPVYAFAAPSRGGGIATLNLGNSSSNNSNIE